MARARLSWARHHDWKSPSQIPVSSLQQKKTPTNGAMHWRIRSAAACMLPAYLCAHSWGRGELGGPGSSTRWVEPSTFYTPGQEPAGVNGKIFLTLRPGTRLLLVFFIGKGNPKGHGRGHTMPIATLLIATGKSTCGDAPPPQRNHRGATAVMTAPTAVTPMTSSRTTSKALSEETKAKNEAGVAVVEEQANETLEKETNAPTEPEGASVSKCLSTCNRNYHLGVQ